LEDRVSLRGDIDDETLRGLYATSHCLCLPSLERTEAFGMVLLEAMHYGLPIVASDVKGSGVGWVAAKSPYCFLVPPGDASALAEALSRVPKKTPISPEGGTHLPSIFHIETCAYEIKKIYQEVLLKGLL
jgi:glycosyltransferase involved in cell wall biosynthesis